jgi:hypothetical protein
MRSVSSTIAERYGIQAQQRAVPEQRVDVLVDARVEQPMVASLEGAA